MKMNIRAYDFVHFAGHADYVSNAPDNSGWKLTNGNFTAGDIHKMTGGGEMPALVFSNACQTARTEKWDWQENGDNDSFGLANAFMLAGVRHYLGTFWEITDEPGNRFALEFYNHLLAGRPVGEAVRLARLGQAADPGSAACWASYILYGDPASGYFNENAEILRHEPEAKAFAPPPSYPGRTRGNFFRDLLKTKERSYVLAACLAAIIILLGFVLFQYGKLSQPDPSIGPEAILAIQEIAQKKRAQLDQALKELEKITGESAVDPNETSPSDDWTSEPLTLSMDFNSKRCFPINAKENLVSAIVGKALLENTRVVLLERISLDTVIDELKLANTKLIAPGNRIAPKLLTAKLILFLEVNESDREPVVLMHLAVTRESRVIDYFVERMGENSVMSQDKTITGNIVEKIRERFPLRGKIADVSDFH